MTSTYVNNPMPEGRGIQTEVLMNFDFEINYLTKEEAAWLQNAIISLDVHNGNRPKSNTDPLTEVDLGEITIFPLANILEMFPIVLEVELKLEAQDVVVDKFVVSQCQITAKQDDMSASVGDEIAFDHNDHIERLSEALVQHDGLIGLCQNLRLFGGLDQVLSR